ncbi:vomeronasal type-2 receptor 1-like [Ascaphus truei]|uniref:vomeronasal type-2 receptor 1-like n=1 Tax=Ascaphus truei TaxID=8439 RepID=UPI003F5A5214
MEKEMNENVGQKEAEMENTESPAQNQMGKRTAVKTSSGSNEARSKRQAEHEKRRLGVTEIVIPQISQAESLNNAGNTPETEQETAQTQEEVSEVEMAEAVENAEAVEAFEAQEMEIPKMGEKSIQPAAASKPFSETGAAKAKSLDCPEAEHNHYTQKEMSCVQNTASPSDKENTTESSESLQLAPAEEVLKSLGLTYIRFQPKGGQTESTGVVMSLLYWSIWHLVLSYLTPASRSDSLGCKLRGSDLTGVYKHGDVLIGAVLPLHLDKEYPEILFTETPPQGACKFFSLRVFQQFQAMRFAMEEIDRRPDLLPNLTMGFQIYDSCRVLQRELDGTLKILTGQNQGIPNFSCREKPPLAAIIGHSTSTLSILMAHILGLYRSPQDCSNPKDWPIWCYILAGLGLGWWLRGLTMDNRASRSLSIKQEIFKAGACVAFIEYIITNRLDKNAPHLTRVIRESTAKAILFFTTDIEMIPLLDEMLRQNVTGKIFVASDAWSNSIILLLSKYFTILSGSIGFAFYSSKMAGFRGYLNSVHPFNSPGETWSKIFWEEVFGCRFMDQRNLTGSWDNPAKLCTGNEKLESVQNKYTDVSSLRGSYNIYTAIYIIATALHDLQTCQEGRGPFYNGSCADIQSFKPWQMLHYIQNVRVKLSNGREVFFDRNGDPPAVYDIVNWQLGAGGMMRQVTVGSYDTTASDGKTFNINASAVVWASEGRQVPHSVCSQSCLPGFRKVLRKGEPGCCFQCVLCPQGEISNLTDSVDCFKCPWDKWANFQKDRCLPKTTEFLSYEEPLGTTLAAISVFSSIIPVSVLGLFIYYKTTPIVRANNYSLSCLLLVSLSLCFLCALAFIGYPYPEKCLLRQASFGMVFTLCVSCILAKTIMVVFAFMATKPGSRLRKWTSPRVSYTIIAFCSFLQFLVCISWLVLSPPFQENNIQTKPGVIIAECNEGSPTAFWCMLGYLGLLATISLIVAFLARQLPDNFNEAKFITFSMLAFLSVWVSYIPASLSARGKYTVAMEVFAILSSSWALVVCMFVPKCFIILFRPDMNSRERLMGKNRKDGAFLLDSRLSNRKNNNEEQHSANKVVPLAEKERYQWTRRKTESQEREEEDRGKSKEREEDNRGQIQRIYDH